MKVTGYFKNLAGSMQEFINGWRAERGWPLLKQWDKVTIDSSKMTGRAKEEFEVGCRVAKDVRNTTKKPKLYDGSGRAIVHTDP